MNLAGLAPGPMCCMLLAGAGRAHVIRIDRAANIGREPTEPRFDTLCAPKNIALDLGELQGVEAALRLCEQADILTEGFRPNLWKAPGTRPGGCDGT